MPRPLPFKMGRRWTSCLPPRSPQAAFLGPEEWFLGAKRVFFGGWEGAPAASPAAEGSREPVLPRREQRGLVWDGRLAPLLREGFLGSLIIN